MNLFIPLTKADAARREVWGVAAVEQPDTSGEIMDYEKSKPRFMAWSQRVNKASGGKSLGNVRDSHTMKAVGKIISLAFDDLEKAVRVGVKVLDAEAWSKVQEGVFTGFSIGGGYGERWPDNLRKGYTRYEAIPNELSLVDLPCIPGATFEMVKGQQVSRVLFKQSGESMKDKITQLLQQVAGEALGPEKLAELTSQIETLLEAEAPADAGADESQGAEDMPAESDSGSESEGEAAGSQPESMTPDAVRAIVLAFLEELGLVQKTEDGVLQMGAKLTGLAKAQTNALTTRLDDLQTQIVNAEKGLLKIHAEKMGELKTQLVSDVARLAVEVETLSKRGGVGPVLRDLGTLTSQGSAALQKADALKATLEAVTDPLARQALQQEITRLEIQAVQTQK